MSKIITQIIECLKSSQKILIGMHTGPDGDANGSLTGLAHICVSLDKDVRLYCQTEVPDDLHWLPKPAPEVQSFQELGAWVPDLLILVDCATARRAGTEIDIFFAGKRPQGWEHTQSINIDHHMDNTHFADINYVEGVGATAELIANLAKAIDLQLKDGLGESIYLGITSDTGNFTYASTNPGIMRLAAEIVENGLRVPEFTQKKDNNWSINKMHFWGELMCKLNHYADGRIVSAVITRKMMNTHNCRASDLEGFVSFLRQLRGVDVSLLLREKAGGGSKISLRSMGGAHSVDVQAIAAVFGGGGHKSAAGAESDIPIEQVEARVLEVLLPAVNKELLA
ncbi:MAG: bifunctional oligoribonuclease/PAP phosphatase NrnA [Deltaproteobacteria bacterium]|jgi:phosphoesterase RecJ-like protein|nr:bifunctional oligoribonuclease/PAP phosphatase NrnA [Deltaproteobacteria bacterium]